MTITTTQTAAESTARRSLEVLPMKNSDPRSLVPSANRPERAGQRASGTAVFGPWSRFAVYAVHTRFSAVSWLVADAEVPDELTGLASVVRQEDSLEKALAGLNA